jgi:Secreted protein containing C-terminal beta-propeller domain distantly related to WD-40 repeats
MQIDPLWIIDLSDETNPTILGELEVPGVSTYIHPLSKDQILTNWNGTQQMKTVLAWIGPMLEFHYSMLAIRQAQHWPMYFPYHQYKIQMTHLGNGLILRLHTSIKHSSIGHLKDC